jgi:hypothetical protein
LDKDVKFRSRASGEDEFFGSLLGVFGDENPVDRAGLPGTRSDMSRFQTQNKNFNFDCRVLLGSEGAMKENSIKNSMANFKFFNGSDLSLVLTEQDRAYNFRTSFFDLEPLLI